jgi:hypothetical protein
MAKALLATSAVWLGTARHGTENTVFLIAA